MNEEKCKKCKKLLRKNSNSICCDVCNKWLHFKCSTLTQEEFDFHAKNELEFWRCEYCTPSICKCKLIIKNNQKSILCNICKTKIHLKCSGKSNSESTSNWFCKWCLADILPFNNMDNRKFINLFTSKKNILLPAHAIPTCRICDKGNIIRNSAAFCKTCKHLLHKKCIADKNTRIIDFCSRCREESLPFLKCTDEEICNENFNSLDICQPCMNLSETEINTTFKSSEYLNIFESTPNHASCQFENDKINELNNINFKFYDLHEFHSLSKKITVNNFSLIHTNIESLCAKEEKLKLLLTNLDFSFDVIALSETWNPQEKSHKFRPPILEGYHTYNGITGSTMKGGCGFYIKDSLNYTSRHDLDFKLFNTKSDFECKWIELVQSERGQKNLIVSVHYRHPLNHDVEYLQYLERVLKLIKKENKNVLITGDFNYNLLEYETDNKVNDFSSTLLGHLYMPHIIGPTRITHKNKPSLIDNLFFNNSTIDCTSGNLLYKLSDHLPNFIFINKINYKINNKSEAFARDMSKFNQEMFNKAMQNPEILDNIQTIQ